MPALEVYEEPVEDLTGHPAVVYEDGVPVAWLNHTPLELLADTEYLLRNPQPVDPVHEAIKHLLRDHVANHRAYLGPLPPRERRLYGL